jgi:hypothetical protein
MTARRGRHHVAALATVVSGVVFILVASHVDAASPEVGAVYEECGAPEESGRSVQELRLASVLDDDLKLLLLDPERRPILLTLAGVAVDPAHRAEAQARIRELAPSRVLVSFRQGAGLKRVGVVVSNEGDLALDLLLRGYVRYRKTDLLSKDERCRYEAARDRGAHRLRAQALDPYMDALRAVFARELRSADERGRRVTEFVVEQERFIAEKIPEAVAARPVRCLDTAGLLKKAQDGTFLLHKVRPIRVRGPKLVVAITRYYVSADAEGLAYALEGGWEATYSLDSSGEGYVLDRLELWGI